MSLIKTTIDGNEIEVERDRWALEVAAEMGIDIPTLCNHSALKPYGACRLCVVEVTKGKWTWLTTSCDLPIREGLRIRTDTPAVLSSRKMALELILSRAPQAEGIAELSAQLGVSKSRFSTRDELGKCILCGLCVRACKEIVGVSAISFVERGITRKVGTPFDAASSTCIGCDTCVAVCPTGHIVTVDKGSVRELKTWKTKLDMVECELCSKSYIPLKEFEYLKSKLDDKKKLEKICSVCQRKRAVERLKSTAVK